MGLSAVAGDGGASGSGRGLGLLLGASAGDDSASVAGDTSGPDGSGGDSGWSGSSASGCVTLVLDCSDFRLASDLARARREKLKLARVESVGRLQPPEER